MSLAQHPQVGQGSVQTYGVPEKSLFKISSVAPNFKNERGLVAANNKVIQIDVRLMIGTRSVLLLKFFPR